MRGLEGKEAQNGEWAFTGFKVPKKNKEICLVVDFCLINDYLIRMKYPLATMDNFPHKFF